MKQLLLSLVVALVAALSASMFTGSSKAEVPGGGCSGTCPDFGCGGGFEPCNIVWCCESIPCTEEEADVILCYDSFG